MTLEFPRDTLKVALIGFLMAGLGIGVGYGLGRFIF